MAVQQICPAAEEANFREGIAAYEAGQYDLAAQKFSNSLQEQPAAGTLLNLGLANWRCERTGEAILSWEQSAWLDPFNRAAQENLSYARAAASVNAPETTWFEESSTWLPANWWTWLAGGSLWLAVALMTVPGFFRWRRADWHQTMAAVSLGIFLLSLAPSVGIITRSEIAIVTDKNTALRLTPTKSAEIVATLPVGEPVREMRRRGDFFFIHSQNGNGWVDRGQIQFICPKR